MLQQHIINNVMHNDNQQIMCARTDGESQIDEAGLQQQHDRVLRSQAAEAAKRDRVVRSAAGACSVCVRDLRELQVRQTQGVAFAHVRKFDDLSTTYITTTYTCEKSME